MAAEVAYYPAGAEHIDAVLAELRPQDRDELLASGGPDIEGVMKRGLRLSNDATVAIDSYGRVLCVFGVCPSSLLDDTAAPWLIGTTHLEGYRVTLARVGRQYVQRWIAEHRRLVNYVDARNKWSIAWLRRIGFSMDKAQPFGVAQLPFHRFHMEQADV